MTRVLIICGSPAWLRGVLLTDSDEFALPPAEREVVGDRGNRAVVEPAPLAVSNSAASSLLGPNDGGELDGQAVFA